MSSRLGLHVLVSGRCSRDPLPHQAVGIALMLFLAIILCIAALILLWQAGRQRQASGLPGGRVIYTGTRSWGSVEKPLYDPVLGLTGRPDYLIEDGNQVIPVEVKSTRISHAPYDAHIFQLAVYCLLVHRTYGKRPPYGILHYPKGLSNDRTFAIDFNPGMESTLIDLGTELRTPKRRKEIHRSHESSARCIKCGCRAICDQSLE